MSDYSPNLISPTEEPDQQEPASDTPTTSSSSGYEEEYSGDSKLVAFLIAHSGRYIKNEEQANYLGIEIAIVVIIISIIIVLSA